MSDDEVSMIIANVCNLICVISTSIALHKTSLYRPLNRGLLV